MDWKEEIKQKQDLVNATLFEIEEIKIRNSNNILEPLKEKYVGNIIKICSERFMYITSVDDEKHIRGISIGSYGLDFFIDHDSLEMVRDDHEFATKIDLIEFINKQLSKTLGKIK